MYVPERGHVEDVPVRDRYGLAPGDRFSGPALVEERESTVVIGTGDVVVVDEFGNLIVKIGVGGMA